MTQLWAQSPGSSSKEKGIARPNRPCCLHFLAKSSISFSFFPPPLIQLMQVVQLPPWFHAFALDDLEPFAFSAKKKKKKIWWRAAAECIVPQIIWWVWHSPKADGFPIETCWIDASHISTPKKEGRLAFQWCQAKLTRTQKWAILLIGSTSVTDVWKEDTLSLLFLFFYGCQKIRAGLLGMDTAIMSAQ